MKSFLYTYSDTIIQLLEGRENESKNATPLVDWLKFSENRENAKYLPSDISYELANFEEFMEKRQELMSKALKDIACLEEKNAEHRHR